MRDFDVLLLLTVCVCVFVECIYSSTTVYLKLIQCKIHHNKET